jgi:hypothetical protein
MYEFTQTELEVFNQLAELDRWSIVGAKALSYHGVHRYTGDTDILCHTSVVRQVLSVLKKEGFSIEICDESQATATKGETEFDVLITSSEEYSHAMVQCSGAFYTTCSGLLDMYLLSGKTQSQFDAIRLLQENANCRPSEIVQEIESERWSHYLTESKKDISSFKPRSLEDEFDLEALLLELDDFE